MEAIIKRLNKLVANLSEKSNLEQSIALFNEKLNYEKLRPQYKLDYFDSTHKTKFIKSKVGEQPAKPSTALAIIVPVYRKKKKEYENELEKYNRAIKAAEKEYYVEFEKERQNLIEADNQERETAIRELTLNIESAKEKLHPIVIAIDQEDIIGQSLKNISDIQLLIEIFDNKRADSIKEGVNVLFEDKHRKKMEEYQEEQLRLTREAQEAAENAEASADEAISIAQQALDRANEAYDRADEAYDEARDAYREAQDAYSEARRN